MIRVVGYTRVSSAKQAAPERTSLEWQKAEIQRYADDCDAALVKVFTDVASGASLDNLPQLRAMLRYCERSPAIGGLAVATSIDRVGRFEDPDAFGFIRFRLRNAGWNLQLIEGPGS